MYDESYISTMYTQESLSNIIILVIYIDIAVSLNRQYITRLTLCRYLFSIEKSNYIRVS
jgi:hypothetical protein